MKRPTVVIGLQWGDEGKGKLVDYLGKAFDVTIRYNGGNNAGHTVKFKETTLHLSLIPSAVLHGKRVLISQAVVINPRVLLDEIEELRKIGVKPKLGIDRRCHVVFPYHRLLDAASEAYKKGKKTGSLKLGIGFTYEDRTNRAGVRMGDLADGSRLEERLGEVWRLKRARVIKTYHQQFGLSKKRVLEEYLEYGRQLAPYLTDVSGYVIKRLGKEKFLLESAQGSNLDFVFGSYPYTVAYHTIAACALADVGLPPMRLNVVGLVKAYTTRVGGGPFATELNNKIGEGLRERGREFGTVSGRPRRCGWLDLARLRRVVELNGVGAIALTKLDVLSGVKKIKVAIGYDQLGKPIYKELLGWREDISGVRKFGGLPKAVRVYVKLIERFLKVRVKYVSVGPDRRQTIIRGG